MLKNKKKINIKYITYNGRIPSRTADSICVMNTCAKLAEHDIDIELIIPKWMSDPLSTLNGYSDNLFEFYSLSNEFKITYLFALPWIPKIGRILFSLYSFIYSHFFCQTDIIHTRVLETAILYCFVNKPVVFESHNFGRIKNRFLFPLLISFLNNKNKNIKLIVTTEAGKRSYLKHKVPEKRIVTIPNGVKIDLYLSFTEKNLLRKSLSLPTNKIIVGYCGSMGPGRGIELIVAVAKLKSKLTFILVGGKPEEVDHYQKVKKDRNITNIQFLGHQPQTKVHKFTKAFDILLMPYTDEVAHPYMSPMKMFDYLASGNVIISSNYPVLREILKNKQNAILVDPKSESALKQGIDWVINHPDKAHKIGGQAKDTAKKYSWKKRALEIIVIYKSLI